MDFELSMMDKFKMRQKKPNRELSFIRRNGYGFNLTADDAVKVERSEKLVLFLHAMQKLRPSEDRFKILTRIALARHLHLSMSPEVQLEKVVDKKRTIESFGRSLKRTFRFEAAELKSMLIELRFPASVELNNGAKLTGEDVMLRGLYELVSGDLKHKIADVFGRDFSIQSRAFSYFVEHVYNNFHHLVHDNLSWWLRNGFWEQSAQAIEKRMEERYPSGQKNMVSHFIDCNCLPTNVVGGGPAESGANAARWNDDIQRAFYNGWKSIHGLKHQTTDNAFGFTEDIYGPTSVRRNDLVLLRLSNIVGRFRALQEGNEYQYVIFGDSAYGKDSHLSSYHKAIHLIPDFIRWNKAMKHVRISIEWNYGLCGTLFRLTRNPDKLKILKNQYVSKLYTVATIFRNLHCCCYGNQTSRYFKLDMPENMMHKYINQIDL